MEYRIRPFRDEDADILAEVIHTAIAVIGPRAYSPAQVRAWAARHPGPERFLERNARSDAIIVAARSDDRAVAYVIVESDGHVDHLYCDPAHTRRGLAEHLLAQVDTLAQDAGTTRFYTEASELARPAFERAGYRVTQRRDFSIDGVAIHNFAMEKAPG